MTFEFIEFHMIENNITSVIWIDIDLIYYEIIMMYDLFSKVWDARYCSDLCVRLMFRNDQNSNKYVKVKRRFKDYDYMFSW